LRKKKEESEEDYNKRIEKAEQRARKIVDEGIIQRFWELVNLFPKITSPELEQRLECFIMNATPGQFFMMQQAIFESATPYLLEDTRVLSLLKTLSGKKLGLQVKGVYESTVSFCDNYFEIERGGCDGVPIISVETRRDYADAILNLKDPVKMILQRRIRATHKLTLLRWTLPHIDILRDRDLFDKYLSYQPIVEEVLECELVKMGF